MDLFHTYIILLPVVFLAGVVDSIAGGGGLLSVPAYIAVGLPPHYVLGNNKFSSCFGTLFTTLRFFKHGLIDVKLAIFSACFALIGSFIGTKTVLMLSSDFLNYLLIILIPIITIFSLLNKNLGEVNHSHLKKISHKYLLSMIAGLSIGFYDGFFGPGTGAFLILFFTFILKYDFITANANTKIINLASNIAAMVTFLINGKVMFNIGIPAVIFGIAGNVVGSKLALTKGNKLIRLVFISVLILLFLKIISNVFIKK